MIFLTIVMNAQGLSESKQNEVFEHLEIYKYLIEDQDLDQAALRLAKVAVIYWENAVYDSAAHYFIQSAEIFENLGKVNEQKAIYTNIGAVLIEQKKYKKATEYYKMSLDIAISLGNDNEAALKRIDYANALSIGKQHKAAFKQLDMVKKFANQTNNLELSLSVLSQYVNIYRNKGDEWKAREYEFRYNHFYDSLEGEVYNLNEKLAMARKTFLDDSISKAASASKSIVAEKTAEKDEAIEESKVPEISTDKFLSSRKISAIHSMDSSLSIEQTIIANLKQERDMLRNELDERIAKERNLYIIFSISLLAIIIGFMIYIFVSQKKS